MPTCKMKRLKRNVHPKIQILMLEVQPETLHFETSSWVMPRLQLCPVALFAVMGCPTSAPPNIFASTHLSLLSTETVARATEELNFEVHLLLINLKIKEPRVGLWLLYETAQSVSGKLPKGWDRFLFNCVSSSGCAC